MIYASDMKIISFNPARHSRENEDDKVIRAAIAVLKRGGVIAYPTETVYGLGCDPRNANAVARIFRIKGRSKAKSLLLAAASLYQARKVATLKAISYKLQARYWPGPLTLVLPTRHVKLAKGIAPHGEVAIRVSSSSFVQALCQAYGFPIVSTSANKSGELDCRSGKAVINIFQNQKYQPDLIIDFGPLPYRKPSTVARIRSDGSITVLRQGAIRI